MTERFMVGIQINGMEMVMVAGRGFPNKTGR
jgi:hypothetical protein